MEPGKNITSLEGKHVERKWYFIAFLKSVTSVNLCEAINTKNI